MNRRRNILLALCAGALAAPVSSLAQSFPSKPMRLIVRAPPGGTDDLIARLISPALSKVVGQQVIVDYRTGAGGLVAWEISDGCRRSRASCWCWSSIRRCRHAR